jgi:hypothetical protein
VCEDESTFTYCFVDNPDDCDYVAIDWDLFDQAKADFEGTIYGNLDLYIAETFFTCACDSASPDCTQSTFATHNINACQDPAFQSISCETKKVIILFRTIVLRYSSMDHAYTSTRGPCGWNYSRSFPLEYFISQ